MELESAIPTESPVLRRSYGRLFSQSVSELFFEQSLLRNLNPRAAFISPAQSQWGNASRSFFPQTHESRTSRVNTPSIILERSTASIDFPPTRRKKPRRVEDVLHSILHPNKSKEPIFSRPTCPKCPICLCKCQRVIIIKACLHVFCRDCLVRWRSISRKTTCPLCLQSWDLVVTDIYSMEEYRVIPFSKLREESAPWCCYSDHLKNRASIYTENGPERTAIPTMAQYREPAWFVKNELAVKKWLRREIQAITDLDTLNAEPLVWQVLRLLQHIPLKTSRTGWNPELSSQIWDLLVHSTEIFLHELYVFTNVTPLSLAEFDSWVAKSRTIDLTETKPASPYSMQFMDSDFDLTLQSAEEIDLTLPSGGEIDLTLPSEGEQESDSDVILQEVIDLT